MQVWELGFHKKTMNVGNYPPSLLILPVLIAFNISCSPGKYTFQERHVLLPEAKFCHPNGIYCFTLGMVLFDSS